MNAGTVTIQLDGNPAEDTLLEVARQIEEGMTSGIGTPTWQHQEHPARVWLRIDKHAFIRAYNAGLRVTMSKDTRHEDIEHWSTPGFTRADHSLDYLLNTDPPSRAGESFGYWIEAAQ